MNLNGLWRVVMALVLGLACGTVSACDKHTSASGTDAAEAPVPENRLSGIYFRMISYYNGSYFSFQQEHYFFSRDGKVFYGVPPGGPENFDWAAAAQKWPTKTGTYDIADGKLTITWGGDANPKVKQMPFARTDDGNIELEEIYTSRVGKFDPDTKLEGTFSWAGSAGGGTGAYVGSARSITFAKDGTFTSSALGMATIQARGDTATTSAESQSAGTYSISGNTMTLKHQDGRETQHTVYPFTNVDDEMEINVDGAMMAPSKSG